MLDNVITSDLRGQGVDDFGKSKAMSVIDMTENLRRDNSSKGELYECFINFSCVTFSIYFENKTVS